MKLIEMNHASIIEALNIKNAFDEPTKIELNLDPQAKNVNILQGTKEGHLKHCASPLAAVSRKCLGRRNGEPD